MTDEEQIRFGLFLKKDKPFVEGVLDMFYEQDAVIQTQRREFKKEVKHLDEDLRKYKSAYHDQWYNEQEIEKCWNTIGNYNREHLELHEAIREYIRNKEWNYEENFHCNPDYPTPEPDFPVPHEDGYCSKCHESTVVCSCEMATPQGNKDSCTCFRSGYEGHACPVHTPKLNCHGT
jgi:hypothetical protein